MKIVINKCYGGFSLSREAVKRLAELQGRSCYFFTHPRPIDLDIYVPCNDGTEDYGFWTAFDISNPNEVLKKVKPWHDMTMEERQAHNSLYIKHCIDTRPDDRTDKLLIQVVEELGTQEASGRHAKLKIVEIPDEVEWEIVEFDGMEEVHEVHRSWS